MYWALLSLTGVFTLLFLRNMLNWIFAMDNYFVHKKRLRQLRFESKQDTELSELIDRISAPAKTHLLPFFADQDEAVLEKNLHLIGWDKYFTPKSYRAFTLTLKIAAAVWLVLMYLSGNLFLGFLWGVVLAFLPNLIFQDKVETKRDKIYACFPDFLRITMGFLSAEMPFLLAVEKTLPYVNDEWQELLKTLIVESKTAGVDAALETLRDATGMFEVKEFVALTNLALEQGGKIEDGFMAQVDAITEMQQFLLEKKIARRKTLAILIQAPMMVSIFATFALPLVGDMSNLGLL